ncbi:ubiquitin carboxyl-terminal hydrolase 43 [Ambystoma mexicanum]|uniref:ubiquitin carboxyl-terminal hydrolase 43 n=1 Tax=Ambystoma mexicanum TaxID=8296 RepID=UPI0037E96603
MGDPENAGTGPPLKGKAPKERGGKKPRGLFRRKSLRSVGEFMSRVLKALSTLSHLGGEAGRAGEAEDDDGGFKRKRGDTAAPCPDDAHPWEATHEAHPKGVVHGGDDNNNHMGRARVSGERMSLGSGGSEKTPGVQGLKNHGNTCFMNAVVQCLSNTDLLAEYLGLGRYELQLGRAGSDRGEPPAGRGEVTQQLASLVRALWTLDYTPQLSVEFKSTVSKFGPQFRGNSQHDALEFLLWLLDRVHEDLNSSAGQKTRASGKVEPMSPEGGHGGTQPGGQPSSGQSFVQEHFQAQYRSSLTCPHCHKQSNTFDPFLCVTLPIPLRQTRPLNVTLVFQSKQQRFLRIGLAIPLLGTVASLREMVADEGKIPPEQVILAEVYPSGFQRSFFDDEDLNAIAEGDIVYAFQALPASVKGGAPTRLSGYAQSLPSSPIPPDTEGQRLPPHSTLSSEFLNHCSGLKVLLLICSTDGSGQQATRFGPPLLTREERTMSWDQLQQCILSKMRYLMRSEAQVQNGSVLFRIRVAGGPVTGSYLSPQDGRPLQHPAVDRALKFCGAGGPAHVKLVVEWETKTKERLFGNIQEEVVQDAESVRTQQAAHQQLQHSCTLDECFQLYTKEEQLAPDDAWKCPHCKVLQQGMVKLSLWTLPDILIIHLKRFRQAAERRTKLSTLVKFPLTGLDMAPHVVKRSHGGKNMLSQLATWKQPPYRNESGPPDVLYDLYAVCNHHGSMQGGHYTAYCRNSLDARWYSYDDSNAEPVLDDEVCTRGAYILFYQKRNSIPEWSASSYVTGSTSSTLSDHWLVRLSESSKRGSFVSWTSTNCTSLPKVPDSPVFLDSPSNPEKGGFDTRPLVRSIQGRSLSMKALASSKARPSLTKTMPLRWSFGSKERPQCASGELVEYLESGRRPRYTNESIIPLMTGGSGSESGLIPKDSEPKPTATMKDQGAGTTGRASGQLPAVDVTKVESKGSRTPAPEKSNTLKRNTKPKEDSAFQGRNSKAMPAQGAPLSKAGEPVQPKSNGSKPSTHGGVHLGQHVSPANSFLKVMTRSGKKGENDERKSAKEGSSGRSKTPDGEKQHEGRFALLRNSFLRKDSKKPTGEERPNALGVSNGSSRTSLSNGTPTAPSDRRIHGTLPRGFKESIPNGRLSRSELEIKRSQSASNVQSKTDYSLKRSESLHKNGNTSHQQSRSTPTEKNSSGTLQRMRYHTASLGRKKNVPESSF